MAPEKFTMQGMSARLVLPTPDLKLVSSSAWQTFATSPNILQGKEFAKIVLLVKLAHLIKDHALTHQDAVAEKDLTHIQIPASNVTITSFLTKQERLV
jgi:hypothetical protein